MPHEDRPPRMDLSVIVPLFNEEESIGALHEVLTTSLRPLGMSYEICFVDDGSRDKTYAMAVELAHLDPHLRVIKLRRNYGQTPAMAAGIDNARGKILVTMDGDLQNDPADIPRLIEKIEDGYDIVVGWRHKRQDKLITRKIPSMVANRLIGVVTGVPIKDNGCSLKAYRADVIKNVPLYSEMHRFIPAMASITGARIAEIKVRHHPRRFGTSKYGLSRIYKVLLDLLAIKTIVSFASRPLRWFLLLALPSAGVSIIALAVTLQELFMGAGSISIPIAGTGIVFGALTIYLGLSGVLAEMVFKTGDVRVHELAAFTAQCYGSAARDGKDNTHSTGGAWNG